MLQTCTNCRYCQLAMPKRDDRQFVQVCSMLQRQNATIGNSYKFVACFTWFTWSMIINEDHRSLLRAQCYKLAISPIGELSRKSDFVNIVIWFHSRHWSDPHRGRGPILQTFGINCKKLSLIRFTGTKIAFFRWTYKIPIPIVSAIDEASIKFTNIFHCKTL
jgi:hypothetical protein